MGKVRQKSDVGAGGCSSDSEALGIVSVIPSAQIVPSVQDYQIPLMTLVLERIGKKKKNPFSLHQLDPLYFMNLDAPSC